MRLYVPSGDFADPAYAARTSHWVAWLKFKTKALVAFNAWGLRGQFSGWQERFFTTPRLRRGGRRSDIMANS
jgi:hypothetical protein